MLCAGSVVFLVFGTRLGGDNRGHPETAWFQSSIVRFVCRKRSLQPVAAGPVVKQRYETSELRVVPRFFPPRTLPSSARARVPCLRPNKCSRIRWRALRQPTGHLFGRPPRPRAGSPSGVCPLPSFRGPGSSQQIWRSTWCGTSFACRKAGGKRQLPIEKSWLLPLFENIFTWTSVVRRIRVV